MIHKRKGIWALLKQPLVFPIQNRQVPIDVQMHVYGFRFAGFEIDALECYELLHWLGDGADAPEQVDLGHM